jgi:hypothetical protein
VNPVDPLNPVDPQLETARLQPLSQPLDPVTKLCSFSHATLCRYAARSSLSVGKSAVEGIGRRISVFGNMGTGIKTMMGGRASSGENSPRSATRNSNIASNSNSNYIRNSTSNSGPRAAGGIMKSSMSSHNSREHLPGPAMADVPETPKHSAKNARWGCTRCESS